MLKLMVQGAVGVKEMSLDCANGTSKLVGDGFQGQVLFVPQDKHAALAGRQGGECGAQLPVKLIALKSCGG